MKRFTYTDSQTGRLVYQVDGPNYWDASHADKKLKEEKKIDILFFTPSITREIKSIPDKRDKIL